MVHKPCMVAQILVNLHCFYKDTTKHYKFCIFQISTMSEKRVYTFGNGKAEGRADMRNLLGGKGANLAEMNLVGVPVPPGFTITTDVCTEYYEKGKDDT